MRRTLFITAAVPLLLLVGGGGAVAAAAPAAPTLAPMTDPDPSDDQEERIRQFAQCLRDNGVDLPDPAEADGSVHIEIGPDEKAAFDDALEACAAFAPARGRAVELDPALRERFEEFHECLSDHGVDLPGPGPGAGGIVLGHVEEAGAVGGRVLHQRGEAGPGTPPPPGAPRPAAGEAHVATPLPGSEEAVEACKDLLPVPPGDGPVIVGSGGDVIVGEVAEARAGGVGITIAVAGGGT
ncbi:hypothetical protein [Pseudonocardia humida]|uniref:Subtilisin inhibitor-like n=1 Tax=Pseudonocardia humida TaxID=2800819 RepID=A0ABT1A0G7_9PSEU|nr:hypothetical protein [Pseudonocardia humida]MCO1656492.1 hypothetical protein [Pseudonocardia humida]